MKQKIKQLQQLLQTNWKARIVTIAIGMLFIATIVEFSDSSAPNKKSQSVEPQKPISADQFTPPGHVLFPLPLQNAESLASVIGQMGKVEVYNSSNNQLIAKGLKVFRSHPEADTFVAVVPENQIPRLLKAGSQLVAVIKNPKDKVGTKFVNQIQRKQRLIVYGIEQK